MSSNAGVWIDHRQSVVVTLTVNGEHIAHIVSNVEKHLERGGDSPLKGSYEARQVPADDSRQRALTGALNVCYDTVTAALRDREMATPGKRLVISTQGTRRRLASDPLSDP